MFSFEGLKTSLIAWTSFTKKIFSSIFFHDNAGGCSAVLRMQNCLDPHRLEKKIKNNNKNLEDLRARHVADWRFHLEAEM
jgi:hypothetical protein